MNQLPRLGPFELLRQIGKGGMGEVWLAKHKMLGASAAVKVITSERQKSGFKEAMRREFQAMAGMQHPSIVELYDVGEVSREAAEASQGALLAGSPWFAMEFARGGALEPERVESWSVFRRVMLELLDGLSHAHARRIIHRDLKPDNVLVQRTPVGEHVLLTDFGVAYAMEHGGETTTEQVEQRVAGTPLYMAPEQLLGRWRDYGPWTDMYAAGVLGWELACGRVPFTGENAIALAGKHLSKSPPSFEPRFPVPDELEAWLRRLLEKRFVDRYESAADAAWNLNEMVAPTGEMELISGDALSIGTTADTIEDQPISILTPTRIESREHGISVTLERQAFTSISLDDMVTPPRSSPDDVPPVPEHWLAPESGRHRHQVSEVALSLFGLREIPFVGRESARDTLWRALANVARQRKPRLVIVRGRAGVGKSRLAEWLTQRAVESGVASAFRATHNPAPGGTEGIGPMLSQKFGFSGLSARAVSERMELILRRLGASGENLEQLSATLARIIRPSDTDEHSGNAGEQNEATARLMCFATRMRPAIVWLDDVQWGAESLDFVDHCLRRQDPVPLLFMLTAREEDLPQRPVEAAILDLLAGRREAQTIEVPRLPPQETRQLVQSMLALDEQVVSELVARSEGVPLFAVQLLDDQVQRGLLTPGPNGVFTAAAEALEHLPEDVRSLWQQRLEELAAAVPDWNVVQMLEMAAVLGHSTRKDEWTAACDAARLGNPARILAQAERRRLGRERKEVWAFSHGLLRTALVTRSQEANRWADFNRAAATMLIGHYESRPKGLAIRIANHLVEAGEEAQSLPHFLQAIDESVRRTRYERAEEQAARVAAITEKLGFGKDNMVLAELELRLLRLTYVRSRMKDVVARAKRLAEDAARSEWWALSGEGELWTARAYEAMGNATVAEQHYQLALTAFERAELDEGIHRTLVGLSGLATRRGDFDTAIEMLEQARQWSGRPLDAGTRAAIGGRIRLAQGHHEAAREQFHEARQFFYEARFSYATAASLNDLAEAERAMGNTEEARSYYQSAIATWDLCGSRERWTGRLNLALLDVSLGAFQTAREGLSELLEPFQELDMRYHRAICMVALARCAAELEDEPAVLESAEQARQHLGAVELTEVEIAELFEQTGDAADRRGFSNAAMATWAEAREHYKRLGNEEAVTRLEQKGAQPR